VIGADYIGSLLGERNVIVSDMGGTSFDVGLVIEGRERVYEMDPVIDRFRVQIPYVAHWSIGAGGGSIARLVGGQLKVGPDSAGSNPGPACYDRGGRETTVTDADLALGYIDPDRFLGGRIRLRPDRAHEALERQIARPLDISVVEAAWRVKRLIDGIMGQEMHRICSLTSGQDPREFVLFAMGGAGAVHACGYAEGADISRIATFPYSSVFGAFSTLALDILQAYERTFHLTLFKGATQAYLVDGLAKFNEAVAELRSFAERDMLEEGFRLDEIDMVVDVNVCYGQQRKVLAIRVDGDGLRTEADVRGLCEKFNAAYAAVFGKGAAFPQAGIELNEIRLSAVGVVRKFVPPESAAASDPEAARSGSRKAYWGPSIGLVETPVYDRDRIGPNVVLHGPILCDAEDTVIVLPPGWRYRTDKFGFGWMERLQGSGARN
jgi:N-methylhydantoinase A/acetophenone carboxylase